MVLATQNPLEYQGTFPLPEAQLDRFFMCLSLGYPEKSFEMEILKHHKSIKNLNQIEAVVNQSDILEMQTMVDQIKVHDDIVDYIVNIANTTRNYSDLSLGASTRAAIDLLNAGKARAFIKGRDYVIPDDVKAMVVPVLSHRLILSSEARIERKRIEDILKGVLGKVFLPVIANESF